MRIKMIAAGLAALATLAAGCASMPDVTLPFAERYLRETVSPNPLIVSTNDFDLVWKQAVRVLDEYFDIAAEDRLGATIVTQPMIGATK